MGIATYSYNRSTSGGEIITHLINSTDGAGLHFDGVDGSINIASPPDLGTKFSFEYIIQMDAAPAASGWSNLITDFATGGRFFLGYNSGELVVYSGAAYSTSGLDPLSDLKPHHLVITIDGTVAKLFDNGNEVGTILPITSPNIDLCTVAEIGAEFGGGNHFFSGNIFRTRFWNKTLSQAEVTSVYESASLDYADQWGSQTELVTNGTFTGSTTGWNLASVTYNTNKVNWAAAVGWAYIRQTTWDITEGEKYRLTFDVSGHSADGVLQLWDYGGAITITTLDSITGNGTFTHEFTALKSSSGGVLFGKVASAFVGTMDNVSCVRIGCVSDYDLAFAQPEISTTIQNRSGSGDGTSSATGVTQVTPIEQLNSKSARIGTSAATPADGDLLVSGNVGIGGIGNTPSRELEVTGPGNVYIRVTAENADDSTALELKNTGGTWTIKNDDTASETLIFGNSGGTRLAIDGSGNVGIGTSTVNRALEIAGNNNAGAKANYIRITDTDTSATANNQQGGIEFYTSDDGPGVAASIEVLYAGSGGGGEFTFNTAASSSAGVVEAMRIDENGNVGVGGSPTSPSSLARYLYVGDTSSAGIVLDDTNSTPWEIYNIQGSLYFAPNGGAAKVTLASSGLATFSNGIAFSGQTESTAGTPAASSVLSHYETGSWTPTLTPGGGSFTTLTYTIQRGRYIRTGNQVWCAFEITVNAFTIGTGVSYVKLAGLPFDRGAAEDQYGSGTVTQYSGWTNDAPVTLPRLNAGTCILRYATSSVDVANVPPANITAGCVMNGFMTYSV